MKTSRELRIEQLLGRELLAGNNQPVGRIEEFRAQRRGHGCVATEIIVGMIGFAQRMNVARIQLFGGKRSGYIVRWDQIDVSDPTKPRLTVPAEQLEKTDEMP
jgi:hypothetical protein